MVIQSQVFAGFNFSWAAMDRVSFSPQGKSLTVLVANDKVQTFMKTLAYGKTWISNFEFKIFPALKDFLRRLLGTLRRVTLKK